MFRPARSVTAAVLAACLSLAAGHAHAQQAAPPHGPLAGFGIGVSNLHDDTHLHRTGPTLNGRVGWPIGGSALVIVEMGMHGFVGDESYGEFSARTPVPPPSAQVDLPPDDPAQTDPPRVLKTITLLVSLQIPITRDVYVRPGLGLGQHSYAATAASPAGWGGRVEKESGSAGELAVGHQFAARTRHPVAMEGFAMISSGTESISGWRWATGFRVIPQIR
jgi:hypothetical protein